VPAGLPHEKTPTGCVPVGVISPAAPGNSGEPHRLSTSPADYRTPAWRRARGRRYTGRGSCAWRGRGHQGGALSGVGLVIGHHGHSRIFERTMESTAQSLVRHAPCPMLVAK